MCDNFDLVGGDIHSITFASSTDVREYLLRKKRNMINCMFSPLRLEGIVNLHELCTAAETELDQNSIIRIGNVLSTFPVEMIELAGSFDENSMNDSLGLTHFMLKPGKWKDIHKLSAKELQLSLKKAMNKITPLNIEERIGVDIYDKKQILLLRRQCQNIKLRHIYFRLLARDFYTKERMFKFGMCDNDKCNRCGLKETFGHLLWDCFESRKVWESFNNYLTSMNLTEGKTEVYEDIFKIGKNRMINMLKIETIQTFIQIEKPTGWTMSNI